MSEETRAHIFEPFFTTKGGGKGTGLGLATVDAIVKNHGGFIVCGSRVGKGTTFRILFPVMEGESPEEPKQNHSGLKTSGGGTEGVLLVDDEKPILSLLNEILERHGYRVTTATSGEAAISTYCRRPADLVILDMDMPGMDGLQAVRELLSLDKNARVIISSGYSMNSRIEEALSLGAKGFLAKPYNNRELLEMVRLVADGGSSH
jgi:CheY-like chemotaxis protein